MDPRHRDRVAFVRVCSGEFERDMTVRNARTGKDVRLSRAMRLFADDRESSTPRTPATSSASRIPAPSRSATRSTTERPVELSADSGLRAGTFRSRAQYRRRRVTNRLERASAQLREEGAVQVFYPWGRRAPSRSLARSASCSSRSRSTASNRSTTSRRSFRRCRSRSRGTSPASASTLAARICRRTPGSSRIGTAAPVALFESEWSVRLAENGIRSLRLRPFSAERGDGGCRIVRLVRSVLVLASRRPLWPAVRFRINNEREADRITHAVMNNDLRPVENDIAQGVTITRVKVAQWSDELNAQGKLISDQRDDRELRAGLALLRRKVRKARRTSSGCASTRTERSSTGTSTWRRSDADSAVTPADIDAAAARLAGRRASHARRYARARSMRAAARRSSSSARTCSAWAPSSFAAPTTSWRRSRPSSASAASSRSRAAITRKASRWPRGCSACRRRSSCRTTRRRRSWPRRAATAPRSSCTIASRSHREEIARGARGRARRDARSAVRRRAHHRRRRNGCAGADRGCRPARRDRRAGRRRRTDLGHRDRRARPSIRRSRSTASSRKRATISRSRCAKDERVTIPRSQDDRRRTADDRAERADLCDRARARARDRHRQRRRASRRDALCVRADEARHRAERRRRARRAPLQTLSGARRQARRRRHQRRQRRCRPLRTADYIATSTA